MNFLGKKPVSIKFPNDLLLDIDEECNGLGCNRTDFVIEAVQEKLEGKTEDQEVIKDTNPEPKPKEPKPTLGTIKTMNNSKGEPTKYKLISLNDSGVQLWDEIEEPKEVQKPTITLIEKPTIEFNEPKQIDNSNKPQVNHVLFNGKYIPEGRVYNT